MVIPAKPNPELTADNSRLPADVSSEPGQVEIAITAGSNTVRLHRRGGLYYQEAPYDLFWFALVIFLGAIFVGTTSLAEKYILAGFMVSLGVAGGVLPFFVLNGIAGTIVIDPQDQMIEFRRRDFRPRFAWSEVVTLQICCNKDSSEIYYQLNLVRRKTTGQIERYGLQCHGNKKYVVALGEKYADAFGFSVVDQSSTDQG